MHDNDYDKVCTPKEFIIQWHAKTKIQNIVAHAVGNRHKVSWQPLWSGASDTNGTWKVHSGDHS